MGLSMCGHLLGKGYTVTVYNRTKSKAQPLLDKGAQWGDSPRAVAAQANVTFTMVGYPRDVREVYFGADGVLAGVKHGSLVIDMTTTEPSLSKEIYAAAEGRGVGAIDAPVSGGDVGARNAALSIMVGGEAEAVERVRPLLEILGKTIIHQGGPGAGQHAKMCNQIVIAGTMIGVCESLLYGYKAGLNLETMLQSIRGGAAGCWSLDNLAPRILGLVLPGLRLVDNLYRALQAQGHGRDGTQALYLALESMSQKPA
jgi:3-hydroxyisobutyrate dehydrogenase